MVEAQKKIYILDTNVLIHDPQAVTSFPQANVAIPVMVLEELDQFKSETTDRGRNARDVIRRLDGLREHGSLRDGVALDHGGTLRIIFPPTHQTVEGILPAVNASSGVDNRILDTALALKQQGMNVVFISKDINARVKADALGLTCEDYLKGRIAEYELYKGWRTLDVPAVSLKKDMPGELQELAGQSALVLNEFVLLQSNNNPFNYRVFRYTGRNEFIPVYQPQLRWPLEARNAQQLMTLNLLLDPRIEIATLVGPAGTGKTFLALLAGLHQVLVDDLYEKIMVTRPVIPLGPDIGYLPGDIHEKLFSWMQPVYDNMALIAHAAANSNQLQAVAQEEYGRDRKRAKHGKHRQERHGGRGDQRSRTGIGTLDDMIASGKISLDAITYMRGRSIPYQYILIDEVQNLTPHEVKTIVTRVGQGSKIILAGDPYQIDSPYLDFSSNGLVVLSNAFKGQSIFGTVFLETSERSELSRLASTLL